MTVYPSAGDPAPFDTVGAATVRLLVEAGVRRIFGIPGSHTLGLYHALDGGGLDHVAARHEQGAGFMADGAARSTGRPGVCAVICGPGVSNVATAVGQAYSDSVPMLVLAGDLSRAERGGRGGHSHELRDQDAVLRAVTDRVTRANEPEDVLHALADALGARRRGRPGPVVVQVPQDLWDAPAGPAATRPSTGPAATRAPAGPAVTRAPTGPAIGGRRPDPPDPAAVAAAAAALAGARRPVIVAGGGAMDGATALRTLAERLDAPVLTSLNGKGAIAGRHRLHAGLVTQQPGVPGGAAQRLLAASDVVLAVGTELGPTDFWAEHPRLTGTLIQVDLDPAAIARHRPVDIAVAGAADDTLTALVEALPVPAGVAGGSSRDRGGAGRAADCRAALLAEALPLGARFRPWIDALRAALPDDGCLATDSTSANYYGATPLFDVHCPRGWLNPSGLGTLGYAVPAAIGAAVANPGRATVALVGDGGLLFTAPELLVAAERDLPLVTVVWANGGYGEIAQLLAERGAGPVGCRQRPPDYLALAAALGCRHAAPANPAELAAAVTQGLAANQPTLAVVIG